MDFNSIKTDCRFFRGDIPCKPHKKSGVHCVDEHNKDCEFYDKIDKKILIIKLGAIGDVIRTTPLFERLKSEYKSAKIFWITLTPSVIPVDVDLILNWDDKSLTYLRSVEFDLLINLDKDEEACALANQVTAKEKQGYVLKDGIAFPANDLANHKFMTGLFDDLSKNNTKNYLQEIFEICRFDYRGEKYKLSNFPEFSNEWQIDKSKPVIGLNTGCGGRWTSRLWADENWIKLASDLIQNGYNVIFLGGKQEDKKNKYYSQKTGGTYLGYFSLEKFINLVDQCNLVVTGVTMAMHITLALNKKIVLFNNIFNPNEFELFGLGKIVEPSKECKCYFKATCENDEYKCMEHLSPEKVLSTISEILDK